jgi:tRNA pseudouridine38-40 synthase
MQENRFLFKVFYIASKKFFGSQRQKIHITVEDCIINALIETSYIKDAESAKFEVASRTDRFVSARGSVLSFITLKNPILMEINSILPREIGLWAYALVPNDYLSRYNAIYRHYKYFLPLMNRGYYDDNKLKLKLMKRACQEIEGHHDFINFSKRGKEKTITVRDVILASIRKENNFIIFDFKSKAFLRQQIRRMVSKILELGTGKIEYDDFLNLFNSNLNISYQAADPRGLVLWDIKYDEKVKFNYDLKSIERMNAFFLEQEKNYRVKYKLFNVMQHNDIG